MDNAIKTDIYQHEGIYLSVSRGRANLQIDIRALLIIRSYRFVCASFSLPWGFFFHKLWRADSPLWFWRSNVSSAKSSCIFRHFLGKRRAASTSLYYDAVPSTRIPCSLARIKRKTTKKRSRFREEPDLSRAREWMFSTGLLVFGCDNCNCNTSTVLMRRLIDPCLQS